MTATTCAPELKTVFREGWCNTTRVDNWVNRVTCGEFEDAGCRRAWLDALRVATGDAHKETALDVGTGPGTIAQLWAELGWKATGVDFSTTMIAAGRRLASAKKMEITFVEGDAEEPPFPKAQFVVVSSRLVLFTLPHPGRAVHRWARLLKPGGRMVLIGEAMPPDADKQPAPPPAKPRAGGWQPDERYREALSKLPFMRHTPETLSVVMEAAGLRDVHAVDMTAVMAARTALRARDAEASAFQSTPYLLVGTV
jgi:ubiquinone/menaquinone biosynthesis C-methylase UbiE